MSFDRLAPHYDWMEALLAGRRLQRARERWLGELAGRKHILSVGEGHGRFAAACATRWPDASLTCVDASGAMQARARRRLARTAGPTAKQRVRWIQADALAWEPPAGAFDAIVTCFFLDCFPPETLRVVIPRLARAATVDAVWLVSDFTVPERGLRRARARAVHALMYTFFRCAARLPARHCTPPDPLLEAEGFRRTHRAEFEWGLLAAEVWKRSGRPG